MLHATYKYTAAFILLMAHDAVNGNDENDNVGGRK